MSMSCCNESPTSDAALCQICASPEFLWRRRNPQNKTSMTIAKGTPKTTMNIMSGAGIETPELLLLMPLVDADALLGKGVMEVDVQSWQMLRFIRHSDAL